MKGAKETGGDGNRDKMEFMSFFFKLSILCKSRCKQRPAGGWEGKQATATQVSRGERGAVCSFNRLAGTKGQRHK